jgi:uncharacterized protein
VRVNWNWVRLAIATTAGALLIVGRGDLERLFLRDNAPSSVAVDDRAELLEPSGRERIAEYHAALLATHDIDYRVLAIGAADDLERTAHDYFSDSSVGSSSANGRGLLLVIDAANERVRLEVSTSLEGVYTDAFVAYVQNRQMAPFFAAGRVADGILATTELIVARAQAADAGEEFAPSMPARSMGGGASAAAAIGTASDPSEELKGQTQQVEVGGLDPFQVVQTYHDRMAARDARADLPLYSSATVAMLRNWVVTPAQMDNVARTYRECTVDDVRIRDDVAVVRYRVDRRQCAPYFLRREDGAWKLELAALSSLIRFNHQNEWRFQTPLPDRYRFAFEDWRIDRNGFPHPKE